MQNTYNEGMSDRGQDIVLIHDMVYLFEPNDLCFFEDLDCIELVIFFIPSESDSSKGT